VARLQAVRQQGGTEDRVVEKHGQYEMVLPQTGIPLGHGEFAEIIDAH